MTEELPDPWEHRAATLESFYDPCPKVTPMTEEEARRAFGPDAEWDALEAAMTSRPMPPPEAH
jgi:hypothetical protein